MLSKKNNVQLKQVADVKLLGVIFTKHMNNLCIKAGRQNNVLSRLSNVFKASTFSDIYFIKLQFMSSCLAFL